MAGKYGLNQKDRDLIGETIRRVYGNGKGTVPYPIRRRGGGGSRGIRTFDCLVTTSLSTAASWNDTSKEKTNGSNSNAAVLLDWNGTNYDHGDTISVEWIGGGTITVESGKAMFGWGTFEHGLYILRAVDKCNPFSYTAPE